ncbi:hypothetical protein Tco_0848747 [Tanacetum coccineum]
MMRYAIPDIWIAKVSERIGAFYRENEMLFAIMYKDENFDVAITEVLNIGYSVNPNVRFASTTDIVLLAYGLMCISDHGCGKTKYKNVPEHKCVKDMSCRKDVLPRYHGHGSSMHHRSGSGAKNEVSGREGISVRQVLQGI